MKKFFTLLAGVLLLGACASKGKPLDTNPARAVITARTGTPPTDI